MITILPHFAAEKTMKKYHCELCDFNTSVFRDYQRHTETRKHYDNVMITKKPYLYTCECGHAYRFASGLSRHKKVCPKMSILVQKCPPTSHTGAGADDETLDDEIGGQSQTEMVAAAAAAADSLATATALDAMLTARTRTDVAHELQEANKATNTIDKATRLEVLVEKLLLETKDLRELVVKQTELSMEREAKILELASRPTSVVNKFSIVNYLNTECNQAMSLDDFVDSLQVTMDDMYYTRDNGYVKGVCNVFARSIENLKQTERPIHCTDKKRLKFFIKENDKWVRDDNNNKLTKVMTNITEKHIAQLHKWKEAHPNWMTDESLRDEFILLTSRILERESPHGDKIVRNVIKSLGDYTEVKL